MNFIKNNFGWVYDKIIPKAPSEKNKLKLIIKNFGWLFGDRILRLGGGALTTIWITR